MDVFWEILKILIPSAVVFLTCYLTVKGFLENDARKRLAEIRLANQGQVTPVRLQAYERIAMFLERISPNSLILRVHKSGMSARLLQSELIANIRAEFEHNLSQQIYMSNHAWEMVKTAKEEIIKLINIASTRVSDTAAGMELAQKILEISSQVNKLPTQVAIEYIKKEIGQTF